MRQTSSQLPRILLGDAEGAEAFHRRALRARELVDGPNHPDVPILLSNLAGTLYVQVCKPALSAPVLSPLACRSLAVAFVPPIWTLTAEEMIPAEGFPTIALA